jgi:hypothetical protein
MAPIWSSCKQLLCTIRPSFTYYLVIYTYVLYQIANGPSIIYVSIILQIYDQLRTLVSMLN